MASERERPRAGDRGDVPLCTRCVRPVSPFATRCPHCSEPIGSSTILPYESIEAEWAFIGRALARVGPRWRLVLVALILVLLSVAVRKA